MRLQSLFTRGLKTTWDYAFYYFSFSYCVPIHGFVLGNLPHATYSVISSSWLRYQYRLFVAEVQVLSDYFTFIWYSFISAIAPPSHSTSIFYFTHLLIVSDIRRATASPQSMSAHRRGGDSELRLGMLFRDGFHSFALFFSLSAVAICPRSCISLVLSASDL